MTASRVSSRWADRRLRMAEPARLGRCRVPARRPGNFHLLAQMKVTKAKCLNTHLAKHLWGKSSRFTTTARAEPLPLGVGSPLRGLVFLAVRICSARRRGLLVRGRLHAAPLDAAAPSPRAAPQARGSPARLRLKPRQHIKGDFRPMKSRSDEGSRRNGTDDRGAPKKASGLQPSALHKCVFQAVCFGDFHLGQQMKVTRPPGRDPATVGVSRH